MALQDGHSQVTNVNLNNLIEVYNSNNGIQKIIILIIVLTIKVIQTML